MLGEVDDSLVPVSAQYKASFTNQLWLTKHILCFNLVLQKFDDVFAENWTVQLKDGELISKEGRRKEMVASKFLQKPTSLSLKKRGESAANQVCLWWFVSGYSESFGRGATARAPTLCYMAGLKLPKIQGETLTIHEFYVK